MENPEKITRRFLGKSGEDCAVDYLKSKNYLIVERGFRLFRGEIDIIAYDGTTLVFVEVKARKDDRYGPPEESVTPFKQQQIRKIAQGYVAMKKLEKVACRFDVISIVFASNDNFILKHFPDAF